MAAAPIHVEHDIAGLELALFGLFEESFQRSAIDEAHRLADAETRQRMLDSLDERQLSPGYYQRASYLLDLASSIETGVQYHAADLTRTDVRGLMAVARARGKWEGEHPACSNCGVRQDNRFAFQCKGCKVKFLKGDN